MIIKDINIREWLYHHRYGFLLFSLFYTIIGVELLKVLFGEKIPEYLVFTFLVASGINLMAAKKIRYYLTLITGLVVLIPETIFMFFDKSFSLSLLSFGSLFLFFLFMAYELFQQILHEKEVNEKSIIGAFAGYFLIGVLAFFSYSTIQLIYPGAFNINIDGLNGDFSDLLYFSFVSITTIGFGDIVPKHSTAKHFVIFFGLIGQFYLAVIVAIMVGKYLAKTKE